MSTKETVKTTIREFFSKFDFDYLKISIPFAETEISFNNSDTIAAWEMYVELITRITIQTLPGNSGDERSALESVHSLFATTRSILKEHGRKGQAFSKIAIVVLNQAIRPFTAKWHRISLEPDIDLGTEFREELESLRNELLKYAKALAAIAKVEDISSFVCE